MNGKITRKQIAIIGAVAIVCAAIVAFSFTYTCINGRFVDRQSDVLVFSEGELPTAEELQKLQSLAMLDLSAHTGVTQAYVDAVLPILPVSCRLLWSIPLTDGTFLSDSTALRLPNCSEADVALLPYFTDLTSLDASGSSAIAALYAYAGAHPTVSVRYTLSVGDAVLTSEETEFSVAGEVDIDALINGLSAFPRLEALDLRGCAMQTEDVIMLKTAYPDLEVRCNVALAGEIFDSAAETLDLSALQVSLEELRVCMICFTELQTVLLPKGLDTEEINRIESEYPNVLFSREIALCGKTVSKGATEFDLSGIALGESAAVEAVVAQLPHLKKLILCDCGLTNEQMEQLIAKYPNIRFVWTVEIGPHKVRTDAIAFSTKNPSKYTSPNASDAYNEKVKKTKRLYEGDIEALKYCTDLEALDLGHNYLTNADLEVIAGLKNLKVLILADNKITDISALSALTELSYLELFMNTIKDVTPLTKMGSLRDLNIANVKLEDVTPLASMTWLNRLWFGANHSEYAQMRQVVEALSDCHCNYTDAGTNGGWREHERYDWIHNYFYGT